jgi:hypothetical protein
VFVDIEPIPVNLWDFGKFFVRKRPSPLSRDEAHQAFLKALREHDEEIRHQTRQQVYAELGYRSDGLRKEWFT